MSLCLDETTRNELQRRRYKSRVRNHRWGKMSDEYTKSPLIIVQTEVPIHLIISRIKFVDQSRKPNLPHILD